MFERLIHSFGQPAHAPAVPLHDDSEVQLAAAVLLFGTVSVDHEVKPEETAALQQSLQQLLHLSPEKSHRLIARAAASVAKDSSIMAAATLLKLRSPEDFRRELMSAMTSVICADGRLHDNERDRATRTARLLGLSGSNLRECA